MDEVTIRRVRPSDRDELRRFYADLSPESRRARFLGGCAGLTDSQSLSFCAPDHVHAEGFVAEAAGTARRLVGHLCLEPTTDEGLELAVAVADAWQGRGIGRRLFEAAIAWARERRFERIVATAYADNTRVLRLLSSAPHPPAISAPGAGLVSASIPLLGPLPQPWRRVSPRRAAERREPATRPCRVFWRRRRRPVRVAGGSASRG